MNNRCSSLLVVFQFFTTVWVFSRSSVYLATFFNLLKNEHTLSLSLLVIIIKYQIKHEPSKKYNIYFHEIQTVKEKIFQSLMIPSKYWYSRCVPRNNRIFRIPYWTFYGRPRSLEFSPHLNQHKIPLTLYILFSWESFDCIKF